MKQEKALHIPIRSRRLRRTSGIRRLFSETEVFPSRLVAPLFVVEGLGKPESISSLPGHLRFSIPALVREASRLSRKGVGGLAIFPCIPQRLRTSNGREALNPKGLIYRSIRALKKELPDFPVFADVALDPYTSHGHDGVLNRTGQDVDNDATVRLLMQQAVLLADAGTDFVA
ncbi:MAG: porphobilinogen synthase, partial [Verrucomicrobia bacterium]|nr:porphobilinogen synthase [Verrucomicrobiota bacterium]